MTAKKYAEKIYGICFQHDDPSSADEDLIAQIELIVNEAEKKAYISGSNSGWRHGWNAAVEKAAEIAEDYAWENMSGSPDREIRALKEEAK